MAETLPVLIKLVERKVEEAQRALARTHEAVETFKWKISECEREAREAFVQAAGENDLVAMQAAGAFQERMRREIAKMKEILTHLEVEEERQRAALQEVFAEQKRYELLHERQQLALKKKKAKKSQEQLDDLAQPRLLN